MLLNSFEKSLRLSSADFSAAFEHVERSIRTRHFTFLLSKTSEHSGGLGLIIAKKKVRFASQRNTCKRVIREFYRQHSTKTKLNAYHLIVLASSYANKATKAELWLSLKDFTKQLDA